MQIISSQFDYQSSIVAVKPQSILACTLQTKSRQDHFTPDHHTVKYTNIRASPLSTRSSFDINPPKMCASGGNGIFAKFTKPQKSNSSSIHS
jgi:hypothetical protein